MQINNFLGNSQKILHTEILLKTFNPFKILMLSFKLSKLILIMYGVKKHITGQILQKFSILPCNF